MTQTTLSRRTVAEPPLDPPVRRTRSAWAKQEERAAWVMLTPWLLGLVAITAVPMVASLVLSFTDYRLLSSPSWVGLENYVRLLDDPRFTKAIGVTFRYVFVSVPLQLAFALALALLLNRGVRGLRFYRSAFYLPSLLGASVTIAILWRQVFGSEGIFNALLGLFGVNGPSWIGNPDHALGTLVVLNVWTFGSPMVIFLAGLRQIPREYYEAAAVDGAGRLSQFFRVTLPLLTPVVFFNVILQFIHAFQAFTPSYIVSGGSGGPVDSTLFYTLYLYQRGFTQFEMGYASAMAWILLLIIGVFTAANFVASRYWVFYGDEK
ncbi:sugar ABC transporter permease [Desertihabitans brevis]|uniref:Sugar ABC transporter permease n=1 Tax=Desertihabitans brevis TaxID=2268447 RepID=A0A367YTV6_9ACTN|nr:sugar ABC transporter permease [Desertihabitans brevis]RCK68959.1 sugar ABC transporter permease [Desertihabitans brevis]